MKENEFNDWKEKRQKGKRRFILKYGILYWGLPMGLFIVFYKIIRDKGLVSLNDWLNIASGTILGIVYGILIGAIYGLVIWSTSEKRYLKEQKKM